MFLEAETSFGLNFVSQLPVNESFVFSPLSIALALSLVHSGAKGNTKSEIESVILKGASDEQFTQHFSFITEVLKKNSNGVETNVANRVYTQNNFKAKESYLADIKKHYGAESEQVEFNKPETAQKINSYVKDATKGKIADLVSPDAIKDAVALLVNAVYFKGEWEEEFYDSSTYDEEFSSSVGETNKIPFMHEHFWDRSYSSDDVFQVLALSYKDTSYKFFVLLPKTKFGLGDSLKKLDSARFQKLITGTKPTYMTTSIPKFKIGKEFNLKNLLTKLGIKTAFTDAADLSNIVENIKLSDGIHKAIIEVDELGTVAAAASAMKAYPMSARMEEPIEFKANHPFLFALTKANHPLFLGVFQG